MANEVLFTSRSARASLCNTVPYSLLNASDYLGSLSSAARLLAKKGTRSGLIMLVEEGDSSNPSKVTC